MLTGIHAVMKRFKTWFTLPCTPLSMVLYPMASRSSLKLIWTSGKSNFFQEEVIGVSDAIELWAGKGKTVPEARKNDRPDPNRLYNQGGNGIPSEYWSDKYQWLPANLAFQEDGTVKFTSYINNLHPKKYPGIYRTIEKLIDTAVPAWDQFLSVHDYRRDGPDTVPPPGRQHSRFSVPKSGR